jgi:hypothetical protein
MLSIYSPARRRQSSPVPVGFSTRYRRGVGSSYPRGDLAGEGTGQGIHHAAGGSHLYPLSPPSNHPSSSPPPAGDLAGDFAEGCDGGQQYYPRLSRGPTPDDIRGGSLDCPLQTSEHSAPAVPHPARVRHHDFLVIRCRKCGRMHEVIQRCGSRVCGRCRRGDYYRLLHGHQENVAGVENAKFVTVTLRNVEHLAGAVERLRACWKKLLRRHPYCDRWHGGIYSIESVHKGHGWNVHLHALVDGFRVSQSQLSRDWLEITGDSYVCDIRNCVSPTKTLAYCIKYLLKPPVCSGHEEEFNQVLRGVRLVQGFGSFFGNLSLRKRRFMCPACGGDSWAVDFELGDLVSYLISTDSDERGPPPASG